MIGLRGLLVATLLAVLALVVTANLAARAQDHNHPPQDAQMHDRFYSNWMRPDQPTASCCNKLDCYPTEARLMNGHWTARRREDGKWLSVPDAKVERNRDSPDGRSHLCAHPPSSGDVPICFVPGGGA